MRTGFSSCMTSSLRSLGILDELKTYKSKNSNSLQEIIEVIVESWRWIFKCMSARISYEVCPLPVLTSG